MANINVQTHNCEVHDDLQAHLEDKLESMTRLWPRVDEVIVRMSQERGRYAAEITLLSGGMVTRGEERSDNQRAALDSALSKLEGQLRRYKKKMVARDRRHDNRDDVTGEVMHPKLSAAGIASDGISQTDGHVNGGSNGSANGDAHDDDEHNMVRVKRFALKPMSAEEASLQMGLLGHNFFVFRDAESNQTSVVYRRRDGGYGLIEPVSD